ncbi:MAG: VOC family protein [Chloroflexi bacterium]|nr:VOC family protein [Chloroflexota bacterium]
MSAPIPAVPPFPIAHIDQVAVVTRDIEATVRAYWERFGIGPWGFRTFDRASVRELTYRGQPADYAMRCAFAKCGDIQFEIIQSLRGPNIYDEFLTKHDAGLHHVGVFVPDVQAAVADLTRRGYAVIQTGYGTGVEGDGGFAYVEMPTPLAALVELIELPRQRIPPDATYPPA